MSEIRVAVAGASGRMGQEVVKLLHREEGMTLVSGISRSAVGQDVGEVAGIGKLGVTFIGSVEEAIAKDRPDVLVDFTTPDVVRRHAEIALEAGVRPVIGTSGLSREDLGQLDARCREKGIGAIVAPNFAIGAVLMMVFAAKASKYLPHVEIIELHHDKKLDAPSGTAVKTAELIADVRNEFRQGHPEEKETLEGARGAYYDGFRIHSVRLPGIVAHQEVLFGGPGQLLTIRHDSLNRESFMPGVKLAIEKVMEFDRLVYGLENILDL
ncbi:4-hydroxy-tetrahydrodipicolinate reductase [Polycladomyces subterraneus]|uniref:4-hydroxy-tetrahydrodipicolinate reductase n=1 Tax=Polycladomyces subterraneus TaxID=1016997 RepID=A0ABT8IM49_9BACL|nr:4-hydroxy-tetrahydrodipicolinate reductase [Polycladomyces subterraneus]MDN4593264.1 4-hydroxy-tetrahydrodipicolinate reductase [Polycladomyces subterraneus]